MSAERVASRASCVGPVAEANLAMANQLKHEQTLAHIRALAAGVLIVSDVGVRALCCLV